MNRMLEQEASDLPTSEPIPPTNGLVMYDKLNYLAPGLAFFPRLQGDLVHGFTWGEGTQNYSYVKEPGYPEESAVESVRSRIEDLFAKMDANYPRRVLFQSLVHEEEILDIDAEYLSSRPSDFRGTFTEGGVFFTREKGVPFTATSADCRYALVYAENSEGPVAGIIHGSRNQLDRRLPQRAINHLIYRYGILPEAIRVGITPGISSDFHTLQVGVLRDRIGWGEHLYLDDEEVIHLDSLGYFIEQLQEAGVRDIEAYGEEACTYTATAKGQFNASDRYAFDAGTTTGRLLIVNQLR